MKRWIVLALTACGLAWSANPLAADSLADFLAYYAKRDKEVQSFRAVLSGSSIVPRGNFDKDPMLPAHATKPVPATDLRLPYRGEIVYDKRLSAIRYAINRELFSLSDLKPNGSTMVHFYNGKEYFVEVDWAAEGKDYTIENRNNRTDDIICGCEWPVFWAAGRLWVDSVVFHKENPPLKWETYPNSEPGKIAFKNTVVPEYFRVFFTSGPPHWDIEQIMSYVRGAPCGRWTLGPWQPQTQGIRLPSRWTRIVSMDSRITGQEGTTLEKFELNPTHDLAYFSHTPRRDLIRFVYDGKETIRIDPTSTSWWWWAIAGLVALLVLVAIVWRQQRFGFFST